MTDSFESILDESISALQAGVPIEEILAEVPEYAAQLRPLLYAATILADPNPTLIPEDKKTTLRAEYMKQVAELPAVRTPTLKQKLDAVLAIIKRRTNRRAVLSDLVTITITVLLTVTMAALVLNYMANDAIPGDILYSIKRISESVQLTLTVDEEGRSALEEEFNQRRLNEIQQLIENGQPATVDFKGALETKGKDLWVIEGQVILLPNDATVVGEPQEGDTVAVTGLLRANNVLVADTIKLVK